MLNNVCEQSFWLFEIFTLLSVKYHYHVDSVIAMQTLACNCHKIAMSLLILQTIIASSCSYGTALREGVEAALVKKIKINNNNETFLYSA